MNRMSAIFLVLLLWPAWASEASLNAQVMTGIDVLQERDFDLLAGKRVGLVTNPTGVNRHLQSTIDILHAHCDLRALYGPEHGVRGNFSAGDHVAHARDEATGVPVFSLYGTTRKPTPEMLSGVDVIVYDIQDIGVRSYTYIATLGLVMEAAAENGKELMVLDRPNPLGGNRVEGPLVEAGHFSFVSPYAIPYVYGLTVGELAMMLNQEGMLEGGQQCRLKVVQMEGWTRDMIFHETGLHWVPTSPHIPTDDAAFFYPATGIIGELDPNMIGIGYTLPFQTLVTEHIPALELASAMNALELPGIHFRPIFFKPYYMPLKGVPLQGVQIYLNDPATARLCEIQFYFLQEARKLDPEFNPFTGKEKRFAMFDKVCGSPLTREVMLSGWEVEGLKAHWRDAALEFRQQSEAYYLYP